MEELQGTETVAYDKEKGQKTLDDFDWTEKEKDLRGDKE